MEENKGAGPYARPSSGTKASDQLKRQTDAFRSLPDPEVKDIAGVFSQVIRQIHNNRPVSVLFSRPD